MTVRFYIINNKLILTKIIITELFFFFLVIEHGDDLQPIINDRTLVIANHQSTGDVPMLMAVFNSKPNVLPNLMWIMDRIFKFTNFGIVSLLHRDFFISSVNIIDNNYF